MNTKLTLSIEEKVIAKAKKYAKSQGRSLSNIIEEYLKSISKEKKRDKKSELNDLIKELKGSIKLPPKSSESYKNLLEDPLVEKYLRE